MVCLCPMSPWYRIAAPYIHRRLSLSQDWSQGWFISSRSLPATRRVQALSRHRATAFLLVSPCPAPQPLQKQQQEIRKLLSPGRCRKALTASSVIRSRLGSTEQPPPSPRQFRRLRQGPVQAAQLFPA